MKSIRVKLFSLFTGLLVTIVAVGILMNSLYLENFYIFKNKAIFIHLYDTVKSQYDEKRESMNEVLSELDRVEGINTIIVNRNLDILLNSQFLNRTHFENRLPKEIYTIMTTVTQTLDQGPVYKVVQRPDTPERDLLYIRMLNKTDIVIFIKPMKGIDESVVIANQFFLMSGILVACIGTVLIFIFSKRIIQPVIEISHIAEDLSNLKFGRKVTYESNDELGLLGTSINRMSDKLEESVQTLIKDVDRRKQLVRNLSHELKTPIGVIKGYSEGILFGVADQPEKVSQYCRVINAECGRMNDLIIELLTLSQLESGQYTLELRPLNLVEVIQEVAFRLMPIADEKALQFVTDFNGQTQVMGELKLLDRAVTNYLLNACQHATYGSVITMTLEASAEGVSFTVHNVGDGIPEEHLESLWDVFYKVETERSRKQNSHGLGLSIVYQIVTLHGGRCSVENDSTGVSFTFMLPHGDFTSFS